MSPGQTGFRGGRSRLGRCRPVVVLLAYVLLIAACDRSPDTAKKAADTGIHKTFERGPVAVALDVDRKELSIADRLNLKMTVTSDEEYEVELPAFGEKLEQFGIVDYHTTQPILREKKREVTRSYVLEPFLSGEYKIPPMTVRFWKTGEEDKPHDVETEELTIAVTSLLPEKVADLKIHDIADPVRMPGNARRLLIWGVVVTLVIVCAVVLTVAVRHRRGTGAGTAERRVPAHEQAFKALERLVADNLTAKGEFKMFYQRLSDILRRYIENRFGLHAPERTTEEFLEDLRGNAKLDKEYRALLQTFLGHCDLVKFAEHRPETAEIQKAFDSCKGFIVGTREAPDAL